MLKGIIGFWMGSQTFNWFCGKRELHAQLPQIKVGVFL